MTLVRIAGLMRSGSNLLTWMLRHNFAGVQTATMLLGWKHGPIYRDRRELAIDDFVDPRFRDGIRNFVRDRPGEWQRVTGSELFRAAAAEQAAQTFAVALAVRDPRLWYASCVRIERQSPGFLPHAVSPPAAAAFWNERHRDWLATLGPRSVIVDTDALRREPEAWLQRMSARLGLHRLAGVRLPERYLHPQGTEEIYELLGGPIVREMEREFTTPDEANPVDGDRFIAGLDPEVLERLGLANRRETA